jgi:hypothetical protein
VRVAAEQVACFACFAVACLAVFPVGAFYAREVASRLM